MRTLLLSALLACSSSRGPGSGHADSPGADSAEPGTGGSSLDGGTTDGGRSDGDTADGGATASLHGTPPHEALPAPDFTAVNMDGAARDREDLLGQPTVMWFYPRAGTAG